VAIEIPPGFGRDLQRGAEPEVGFLIDGAIPFRGETIRGYVEGGAPPLPGGPRMRGAGTSPPVRRSETRFRYNQDFKSVYAMVPGLMLVLIMIPATMTAVGVVREKELGSITNLYATPTKGRGVPARQAAPLRGVALLSYPDCS
jgi:ribosome-dependent ATPase